MNKKKNTLKKNKLTNTYFLTLFDDCSLSLSDFKGLYKSAYLFIVFCICSPLLLNLFHVFDIVKSIIKLIFLRSAKDKL
ncbi:hypothetical protein BpHYR1_002770 [Brachionus plicatilis]|uniref:Uncharacterized protein n=1 Tax=Brachionus plicatilis TaxID=10195 RepID=A0A3M7T016_BRAPC|nr:hypothetical protein BpHYR1_002770 [Brachionus plicatilis]